MREGSSTLWRSGRAKVLIGLGLVIAAFAIVFVKTTADAQRQVTSRGGDRIAAAGPMLPVPAAVTTSFTASPNVAIPGGIL